LILKGKILKAKFLLRTQFTLPLGFCPNANHFVARFLTQTIAATSSNHTNFLLLHEISYECVWLRSIIQHVQETYGYPDKDEINNRI